MTASPQATESSCSSETFVVVNPATEAILDEIPCATLAELNSAIDRASRAFRIWRTSEACRRMALKRCAEIIRDRKNALALATLLTQEQGKPKRESLSEVFAAAHWFAALAELELPVQEIVTERGVATVHHAPLGVVGAITSWNYPVFLAAAKIASALLPGNVVVLKPSPHAPLSTIRLAELIAGEGAVLPEGVLTVLPGNGQLGSWLVQSPEIQHVTFTGSACVGKTLLKHSADLMKSTTLELGGNDAAIVLGDVSVDRLIEPLFWAAFTNAGQLCMGIKRLFVQESIFEQVTTKLAQRAREIVVDDGLSPRTQMGPVAHKGQYHRMIDLLENVRHSGATIVAGGEPLCRPGYFFPPTIVTHLPDHHPLVQEEQFGPVLPILSFRDVDEAVLRANATDFGLGGSVWTQDCRMAANVASRLECGTVWINQHALLDPMVPFGGHKQSGFGYENGWKGVAALTKVKIIYDAMPDALG